jgi:hypothetical protein
MPTILSLDGKNFLKNAKKLVDPPYSIVKTALREGSFPRPRCTGFSQ